MEIYYLLVLGSAGVGGYLLGLEGKESSTGLMGSMLAALIFLVPMGMWFAFNLIVYLFKGGRSGFRAGDVREVGGLLVIGVGIWLAGLGIGCFQRIRARR